jgi:hypothetical protein
MKRWEEVADVSIASDDFLEVGLHILKVWLIEKQAAAATAKSTCHTFKFFALSKQSISPESTFVKDSLHPFESTWHGGMVVWEVE